MGLESQAIMLVAVNGSRAFWHWNALMLMAFVLLLLALLRGEL
jgi:hypothetical protein